MDRIAAVKDAWNAYVRHGSRSPGVRDVVYDAWERCHQYFRLDPYRMRYQPLEPARLAQARTANAALITAARPHMERLHQSFGSQPHLVALADPSVYILLILADPQTQIVGRQAALFEGASWHERDCGSNGVGTAIAINQPVVLVGREHYMDAYANWTCLGIPLHGPGGEIIGGIDVSVPTTDLDVETWNWMLAVAEAAERDYAAAGSQAERGGW